MLKIGDKAPEIILINKDEKEVALSSFFGKKVVVYFYPKDNTPGCSRQAAAFAEKYDEYKLHNIEIIGISKDSIKSHVKFSDKYFLPFILLSDTDGKTIEDYDVWKEKKMYGKTYMGIVRTTYLIDEDGIIENIWDKVKPDINASEILEYILSK